MSFRVLRRFAPLSLALTFSACVDIAGLDDMFGAPLLAIGVDGAIVEVGDTVRVTAMGEVGGIVGMWSYDPVLDARWAISDQTIARLESLPLPTPEDSFPRARTLIRGARPGSARVTATARRVVGEAIVRVIPRIGTIRLTAPRDTISVGDTIRVSATARDAEGVPIVGVPLTFGVQGGVELRGFDDAGARIVATSAGPATLSARFRRATGEATLVVVPLAP